MRRPLLAFAALGMLAAPVVAQDLTGRTFTTEDEIALQQCLEAVRDIAADPEAPEPRPQRSDCIGAASGLCQETEPDGQTTVGMAECERRETDWWDDYLNTLYADLEERLAPELFTELRDVQRVWIAYRDANCAFLYDYWAEGTIRAIAYSGCMLEATAHRALELADLVELESL